MYSAEELDIPGIIAKNPLTTLINWEGKRGVEAHELNFGAAPAATTAAADDDCATAAETYGEDVDADGAEEEAAAEHEAGLGCGCCGEACGRAQSRLGRCGC